MPPLPGKFFLSLKTKTIQKQVKINHQQQKLRQKNAKRKSTHTHSMGSILCWLTLLCRPALEHAGAPSGAPSERTDLLFPSRHQLWRAFLLGELEQARAYGHGLFVMCASALVCLEMAPVESPTTSGSYNLPAALPYWPLSLEESGLMDIPFRAEYVKISHSL